MNSFQRSSRMPSKRRVEVRIGRLEMHNATHVSRQQITAELEAQLQQLLESGKDEVPDPSTPISRIAASVKSRLPRKEQR